MVLWEDDLKLSGGLIRSNGIKEGIMWNIVGLLPGVVLLRLSQPSRRRILADPMRAALVADDHESSQHLPLRLQRISRDDDSRSC